MLLSNRIVGHCAWAAVSGAGFQRTGPASTVEKCGEIPADDAPDERRQYYSLTAQGKKRLRAELMSGWAEAELMSGWVEDARGQPRGRSSMNPAAAKSPSKASASRIRIERMTAKLVASTNE